MREGDIAVGPFLAALRLIRAVNGRLSASLLILARLILLGKEHVEANGHGIRLRQRIDDRRHRLPRPWPTADALDRGVVDVDDPDRLLELVRSRLPALILIENEVLEVGPERRKQRPERERQGIGKGDDQDIGPPLPQLAQTRPYRSEKHQIDKPFDDRRPLAAGAGKDASQTTGCVNFSVCAAGNWIQISRSPLSETWPSRPTMIWSCTATFSGFAIAMISCVIFTSCVEGEGSPDG